MNLLHKHVCVYVCLLSKIYRTKYLMLMQKVVIFHTLTRKVWASKMREDEGFVAIIEKKYKAFNINCKLMYT